MSEYVKREDAMAAVDKCRCDTFQQLNGMKGYLNAIPSADVEPVKHGRWIRESVESDNSSDGYFKISMAECSECGTCVMGKPNYCPNCGAKMDEGE